MGLTIEPSVDLSTLPQMQHILKEMHSLRLTHAQSQAAFNQSRDEMLQTRRELQQIRQELHEYRRELNQTQGHLHQTLEGFIREFANYKSDHVETYTGMREQIAVLKDALALAKEEKAFAKLKLDNKIEKMVAEISTAREERNALQANITKLGTNCIKNGLRPSLPEKYL